jgi:hypothetical protein
VELNHVTETVTIPVDEMAETILNNKTVVSESDVNQGNKMEEGGTTDDVTTSIDESEFIDTIGAAENEADFHENNDTEEVRGKKTDGGRG